jgi:hypothetical protein
VRRRWKLTVPAVLVVLVVLAVVGAQLRSQHRARHRSGTSHAPVAAVATTPTLLLAHAAADGRVDLAAVLGARGRDGSVLLVPTLTQAETPSLDLQLLADLPKLGSPALLRTTVENLLGVRIDGMVLLSDAQLTDALTLAGPLTVDLRDPVDVGGAQPRTFPAGSQQVTPTDAATLLTARNGTDELDHLVTVQAVLEGWLRALRSPQTAAASSARLPALAPLVSVAAASTDFSTVPVTALSTGAGERYEVQADALGPAMADAFPGRLLGIDGRRLRVEILNGTGVVGLVQQVAAVIVPAGGEVVTTGTMPGFGQATSKVVYYRDADRAAAARLQHALGVGQLAKEPNDVQVFDVTIIAGGDFHPPAGS